MTINESQIIRYLRTEHGGMISYQRNGFYITLGEDKFKVSIVREPRVSYDFFLYEDGRYDKKFSDRDLSRGLYIIFQYSNFKKDGVLPTSEGWEAFKTKINKFYEERRI